MQAAPGTQGLRCPSCNASDASYPDSKGVYHCTYCGGRYVMGAGGQPQLAAGRAASVNTAAIVIVVVGFVGLLIVASAALIFLGVQAQEEREASSEELEREVAAELSNAMEEAADPEGDEGDEGPAAGPAIEPAPPPKAAASGEFVLHNKQSGYKESYYALGEVTNTSPFAIGKPKIIAVLLDESGNEVTTDFGFASLDVLQAGETSPVKILIKDPPAHADLRFEVVAREASYFPEAVDGLELETTPPRHASFGSGYELEGKVAHGGSVPAKFVQVEVKAIGADGKLVGLAQTYADVEVLQPGASARYKFMSVMLDQEPDHFEFSVRARKAE